ncbi:hypothetical protein BGZ95_002480, partial [Linnemannia exigua]
MSSTYAAFETPGAKTGASPPILSQSQSNQQAPYSPPPVHPSYRPFQAPTLQQQHASLQAYPPPPPVLQHDPKRQSFIQSTPSQLDFSMAGLSLANNGYVQAPLTQPYIQRPHHQPLLRSPATAVLEKSLPALPPMGLDVVGRSGSNSSSGHSHSVVVEFAATTSTLSDELGSYLSDQDAIGAPLPPPPSTSTVAVPIPVPAPPLASNSSPTQEVPHEHSPPNVVTTITTVYSIPSSVSVPSPPSSQQQRQSVASRSVSPPPLQSSSTASSSWSAFNAPGPVSSTNNSQGHS